MSGIFGVASKNNASIDLFFGIDYHSHLGTRRGGMVVYGKDGFSRAIHNIENTPFRTKFEDDMESMQGGLGIGCISDYEPQPILVQSHLGTFAVATVSKINNMDELIKETYSTRSQFQVMSSEEVNATELVAWLINSKDSIAEGIQYAQEKVDGSLTLLVLTKEGIYAARDPLGRTPLQIGKKEDAYCASFESFAYVNLGYKDYSELGPGEIVFMTPDGIEQIRKPGNRMQICAFLWVYYGYPNSMYEGVSVEEMRYRNGAMIAMRDENRDELDYAAGVPDSGTAHAIGYANEARIHFERPFIKYTPTWPRSFMPTNQSVREMIAKMKLVPVEHLIQNKSMVLIDDSIVRGTQLRDTIKYLYNSGAKKVHVRAACPPITFACKFLNFSRSRSVMDLITRRVIHDLEGDKDVEKLDDYSNPDHPCYRHMVAEICKRQGFDSLQFERLDDMIKAIGLPECNICTYCWNGKE
ncbi:MAG: amidophosphoribosyltransferase [Lachnospiraceae bacterium]|nr:amidophosphoribosyltransferase [Lachnospiraceae bacterium]